MNELEETARPSPIAPTSRVLMEGYRFRVEETRDDRQFLICSDGTDTHREILLQDIRRLCDNSVIVIEENFFDETGAAVSRERADSWLSGMDDDELYHCHWMDLYMLELDAAYKAGSVKLHAMSLDAYFTRDVQLNLHVQTLERLGKTTRWRKGKNVDLKGRPSSSDLKRAYLKFRQPGYRIEDHRKHYHLCVEGGKRLDPYVQAVTENTIHEFHANEQKMNRAAIRRLVGAKLNDGRPEGQWTEQPPWDSAIKRLIGELKESKLIGSQRGEDTMERETGSWTEGPRFTQAGEMVQIDCYKTDIVVFLQRAGIWLTLDRHTKRLMTKFRRRVWLCLAIDLATRCVLGIAFGLAESAELAVRTLRMAVSDKSKYAAVAECNGTPPQAIGISGIRTDSGSAFRSARFRSVAFNVCRNVQIGVVGKSRHRGTIERQFRTIHTGFISFWTGRTFSSVAERGDYPSVERMSLFLEEFGNALFRWITDCYHLLGHRGLQGQPPIDCFKQAIANTSYPPLMNPDSLRVAFGLDVERKLTPLGLRFAGIQYSANWLAERFKTRRGEKMRFKVDPEDLGRISVLNDGQWATLPGPPEFRGIPLSFWLAKCHAIARTHGEQARINFEIVAKALLSFASISAEARCRAQLEDWSYNSKKLEEADKRIKLQIVYRPTPAAHGGPFHLTQAGGYATGAKIALPALRRSDKADSQDEDEIFGLDLDDQETPPTKDDRLAADNDNVGEDPILESDEEPVKSARKAPDKAATKRTKKPAVDLDWVPAPRVNTIKKSN